MACRKYDIVSSTTEQAHLPWGKYSDFPSTFEHARVQQEDDTDFHILNPYVCEAFRADKAYGLQGAFMGFANDATLVAVDDQVSGTLYMSSVSGDAGFASSDASTSVPSSINSSCDASLEEVTLHALPSLRGFDEVCLDEVSFDDLEGVPLLFEPSQNEPRSEQRSWHTSRGPAVAVTRSLGAICPQCHGTFVTGSCLK